MQSNMDESYSDPFLAGLGPGETGDDTVMMVLVKALICTQNALNRGRGLAKPPPMKVGSDGDLVEFEVPYYNLTP